MDHFLVSILFLIITISYTCATLSTRTGQPERCCVPKQFSSVMSTSSGVVLPNGESLGTYGIYNFSYDAIRGLVGMQGVSFTAFTQEKSNLWIIENLNTDIVFTYDRDTKQCYKSTLPIHPLSCIPDDAVYLQSVTYGYGNKQIIGDTWMVKIGGAYTYSTVSRDGLCVPLTGNTFLQSPAVATVVTATDFVNKIVDPNIFDIPTECQSL